MLVTAGVDGQRICTALAVAFGGAKRDAARQAHEASPVCSINRVLVSSCEMNAVGSGLGS